MPRPIGQGKDGRKLSGEAEASRMKRDGKQVRETEYVQEDILPLEKGWDVFFYVRRFL